MPQPSFYLAQDIHKSLECIVTEINQISASLNEDLKARSLSYPKEVRELLLSGKTEFAEQVHGDFLLYHSSVLRLDLLAKIITHLRDSFDTENPKFKGVPTP